MTYEFFHSYCVSLFSILWQVLCSPHPLSSPCIKPRIFSKLLQNKHVSVYQCVCRCDVNCDPLRMDKWQKMWFLPSHPLCLPFFLLVSEDSVEGKAAMKENLCVCRFADAPADPPLSPRTPRGELAPEDASLSQHWQAKGGHSPTKPRGNRVMKKSLTSSSPFTLSESCQCQGLKTTGRDTH